MSDISATMGLTAAEVAAVLTMAVRAPSIYNTQPWSFRTTPTSIELRADRTRALPVADPDGYELELSCGAALLNLQLALLDHGIRPQVSTVPVCHDGDLLAVVEHGGSTTPTQEQRELIDAVPRRITNRRPFSASPVPSTELAALHHAARQEEGWLHVLETDEELAGLERLSAFANHQQMSDARFRAEQARWFGSEPARTDGVPAATAGPLPEAQDRWVKRDFTGGTGHARTPGKNFEERPLLLVLSTLHHGPRLALRSGQALQRVLLTATAHGLDASLLSHVVEVDETREQLRQLVRSDHRPDAVLRVGYGSPVPTAPRRAAADVAVGPGASGA
ncbi:MAG: nitroreductase family protein [Mycobacteriaceae bacterium]